MPVKIPRPNPIILDGCFPHSLTVTWADATKQNAYCVNRILALSIFVSVAYMSIQKCMYSFVLTLCSIWNITHAVSLATSLISSVASHLLD